MAERFVVPATTAARINATRRLGGRVDRRWHDSRTGARDRSQSLARFCPAPVGQRSWSVPIIRWPLSRPITGWHEPHASHLAMIEAVAGRELLGMSYGAALEEGYLWHEFGDSQLILP